MTDAIDALQRLVTRRATKAQVEAEAGGALEEVRFAWATDTEELGVWTNGTWEWIPQSSVSTLDGLSDVTITGAVAGDRLRFDGTTWINDRRVWMPLTTVVGGVPELVWDDDDSLIPTEVPT